MRGATECAKRLKLLFSSLRSKLGKVGHPPFGDPITHMLLGILSRDVPEAKAGEGLDRLRSVVVDYNELRVVPPMELAEILGDFPDARLKCEDISRSLNAVFALEHSVSLDRLLEMPKKEARAYLAKIDGLEPYTRARIRLFGLRQHAIPLDEAMWALARQEQVVGSRCPLEEAQQFLERQIAEEDGLEFVALLKRQAWNELGAAVKRREVARIMSVPPDRSARNMLQLVAAGGALLSPEDLDAELGEAAAAKGGVAARGGGGDGRRSARGSAARGSQPTRRAKVRGRAVGRGQAKSVGKARPAPDTDRGSEREAQASTRRRVARQPARAGAASRAKRKTLTPARKSRARAESA